MGGLAVAVGRGDVRSLPWLSQISRLGLMPMIVVSWQFNSSLVVPALQWVLDG